VTLHARTIIYLSFFALTGLALGQEKPPEPQPAPAPAPASDTAAKTETSQQTTGAKKTKAPKRPSRRGSRRDRRQQPTPAPAPISQTTTQPATATTATTTVTTLGVARSTSPQIVPSPRDIHHDTNSHTSEFSLFDFVRQHALATGISVIVLLLGAAGFNYWRKRWPKTWADAGGDKPPSADEFLLWVSLVAGDRAGDDAEPEHRTATLFSRAAERLPQLTREEQSAITAEFMEEWARLCGAHVSREEFGTALLLGTAMLPAFRGGGNSIPANQERAHEFAEKLIAVQTALASEDEKADKQRSLTKKRFDEELARVQRERDEAVERANKSASSLTTLEETLKTERSSRQTTEKALKQTEQQLEKSETEIRKQRDIIQNFDADEAKRSEQANALLLDLQEKLTVMERERDAARANNAELTKALQSAQATIITRDETIKSVEKQGTANDLEIRRIAAGAQKACGLEALQWVGQKRFARKIDDASISSAFLMAGYLAAFQYLRGVVENDQALQDLGVINLRTLLEKISSVTGTEDWKDELRKLIPEAFRASVANENATMSGPPQPEQLLFLSILNHMATLSGDRVDNRAVRVSPLFYRTDERVVRGVR
jgi:hypothetical protein